MTILAREGLRPETRRNRCPSFIFKIQKDMIFQHKFFKTACLAALASLFFACGEHKPGDGHNHGEAAEAEHHEEAEGSLELTDEQMKAVGIALVAFPTMASADFKPSAALFSACRSDAIRLCYGLMSMDAVASCLKSKRSATSARCRAQYDAETKVGLKK